MITYTVEEKDNTSQVLVQSDIAADMALAHMAQDVEIMAKQHVPVSNTKASGNRRGGGGHLQSSIRHRKGGRLVYFVEADKIYAAYQERGMRKDGTHVVRRYSTPGTGKNWFQNAIAKAEKDRDKYFLSAFHSVQIASVALGGGFR